MNDFHKNSTLHNALNAQTVGASPFQHLMGTAPASVLIFHHKSSEGLLENSLLFNRFIPSGLLTSAVSPQVSRTRPPEAL